MKIRATKITLREWLILAKKAWIAGLRIGRRGYIIRSLHSIDSWRDEEGRYHVKIKCHFKHI